MAPMFPDPCSRMLMPWDFAISSPKGMEPSKKAMMGGIQIGMTAYSLGGWLEMSFPIYLRPKKKKAQEITLSFVVIDL